MSERKILTTAHGVPVADQNSITAGPHGPILTEDFLLNEKPAHFNRERIPERVMHAKVRSLYGVRNNSEHERSNHDE